MKKINIILSIAVLLFVFLSCEKEVFEPVINYGDTPVLTSSPDGGSFLLAEENAGETLLSLNWTESDFGFPAAISYTVQLDEAGNNFAKPTDIVTTSNLSYDLTVGKLNTLFPFHKN